MTDDLEILFQPSAEGHFLHLCNGQGCQFFDVVHPAFPLPIAATPTIQGVLKNGFGDAVVASKPFAYII